MIVTAVRGQTLAVNVTIVDKSDLGVKAVACWLDGPPCCMRGTTLTQVELINTWVTIMEVGDAGVARAADFLTVANDGADTCTVQIAIVEDDVVYPLWTGDIGVGGKIKWDSASWDFVT